MKKLLSVMAIIAMLVGSLFSFSGCGNKDNEKNGAKVDTTEVSYAYGKAKYTVAVPKKEDGSAKYEFVKEKPDGVKYVSSFYLETDTAGFAILLVSALSLLPCPPASSIAIHSFFCITPSYFQISS